MIPSLLDPPGEEQNMRVIKRYPNRKLYDTEEKQYITLEGIADLIRDGVEVQVIDNASGDDLTAVTLSQIIFEQEKKPGGFLPRSVLTELVQAGGDRLSSLRRTLSSPLEFFRQADSEIERRIQELINRGELAEDEAIQLRDKLLIIKFGSKEAERIDDKTLEKVLAERGVPTRADMDRLIEQIETLTAKLASLQDSETEE